MCTSNVYSCSSRCFWRRVSLLGFEQLSADIHSSCALKHISICIRFCLWTHFRRQVFVTWWECVSKSHQDWMERRLWRQDRCKHTRACEPAIHATQSMHWMTLSSLWIVFGWKGLRSETYSELPWCNWNAALYISCISIMHTKYVTLEHKSSHKQHRYICGCQAIGIGMYFLTIHCMTQNYPFLFYAKNH